MASPAGAATADAGGRRRRAPLSDPRGRRSTASTAAASARPDHHRHARRRTARRRGAGSVPGRPPTCPMARFESGTPPKGHRQRTHSARITPPGSARNRPGPFGAEHGAGGEEARRTRRRRSRSRARSGPASTAGSGTAAAAHTIHARPSRTMPSAPTSTWSSRAMPAKASGQKPHGGVAAARHRPPRTASRAWGGRRHERAAMSAAVGTMPGGATGFRRRAGLAPRAPMSGTVTDTVVGLHPEVRRRCAAGPSRAGGSRTGSPCGRGLFDDVDVGRRHDLDRSELVRRSVRRRR